MNFPIAIWMTKSLAGALALADWPRSSLPLPHRPRRSPTRVKPLAARLFRQGPSKATPVAARRSAAEPVHGEEPEEQHPGDTWMTGTYTWPGPLGGTLVTNSGSAANGVCSTIAFDSQPATSSRSAFPTITAPQARIVDPDA